MNGNKIVYQVESPKTQSIDAVKALLAYKKVASDPLPQDISLDGGRLVLVLSNKKDAFYTVTARACSCPASVYNPGKPCKHSRKYFPQPMREAEATIDIRASLPGWRGPNGKRANGPVEA
ncbi:MAG: hypothetical protein PHQ39_06975 [Methanothrix soehngenii]|nr:hypothetical protein [Methanothrix soehngenii]